MKRVLFSIILLIVVTAGVLFETRRTTETPYPQRIELAGTEYLFFEKGEMVIVPPKEDIKGIWEETFGKSLVGNLPEKGNIALVFKEWERDDRLCFSILDENGIEFSEVCIPAYTDFENTKGVFRVSRSLAGMALVTIKKP